MNAITVEFLSGTERVRGKFFPSNSSPPPATILMLPGWPGNPEDVLGLGERLSGLGFNLMLFNPRGLWESEGFHTHFNTLADIEAAYAWLRNAAVLEQFQIDIKRIVLAGYSYGGGMGLVYAARQPNIQRVIAIAANDHAELTRQMQADPSGAKSVRIYLWSTRIPDGPCRFDVEADLQELADNPKVFGLTENASLLADRSILLIAGEQDKNVPLKHCQSLYEALTAEGAERVTLHVYPTDHSFQHEEEHLAQDIARWIVQELEEAVYAQG
jgi:pimeloyl-ACP methyl ester carboxylesterase